MKTAKTLLVCSIGLVGGCVTTSQLDNANIQIGALTSRIARIEKDLYRVEVKSAPKQVVEPKFVPATEVEQNVIDTRIDAFMKEYLGVQFGDSIDLYPKRVCSDDNVRRIQVKKPFGYLEKATGRFEDGKLYSVSFVADIDKKYSEDSVNERIKQTLADLAVSFGMSSDAFSDQWFSRMRPRLVRQPSRASSSRSSYSLLRYHGSYDGFYEPKVRRLGAVIENANLRTKLEAEKRARQRAQGEVLPEKKIDAKDNASAEATPASATDDSKKAVKEEAKRVREEARKEAKTEREEMRNQLSSLRSLFTERSLKEKIQNGDLSAAIELQKAYKAESAKSKKELDRLLSMGEKAKGLSPDAFAVYQQKVEQARGAYCSATNKLSKIDAMLTPEKRAELEAKRRSEAEFSAFEKEMSKTAK